MDARLQPLVEAYLGDIFPALALAVIERGAVSLVRAWGVIDPPNGAIPVTTAARFDLASVSKLFTATAMLRLISVGKADLDDPLVRHVPEFGASGARGVNGGQNPHTRAMLPTPDAVRGLHVDPAAVTLRHLLTHTSGLAPWRDVFNAAGEPPPPPDQPDPLPRSERWRRGLSAICRYEFVSTPDQIVRYSDLGFLLLGETVARLHGSGDLAAAIHDLVTEPLGLTTITYNPMQHGISREQIAPTEFDSLWRGRRCWGEVHDENACGVGGVAGHAGLFGTALEIARFGQAWLERDLRLGIDSALMDAALTEQASTGDERRGLGWALRSVSGSSSGRYFSASSFGHTGFTGTSLWIDPARQLVVACLTNRVYPGRDYPGAGKPDIEAFRVALHEALTDP